MTVLGFARLEEADRNFDAAGKILDSMEAKWPNDPSALLSRAVLLGRTKQERYDAIAKLDSIPQQISGVKLGPTELLEKGRLLDSLGRYDEAFASFEEGKRLARELSGNVYLNREAESLMARLQDFFIGQRLQSLPRAAVRTDVLAQPIFLSSASPAPAPPRSIEQTLTAASQNFPRATSCHFINDINSNIMPRMLNSPLGYPEALAELWMGDQREGLDNLRDYYLPEGPCQIRTSSSSRVRPGSPTRCR